MSVHLSDYPVISHYQVDKSLIVEMDLVKELCSLVSRIRKKHNIRARLPLSSITIVGSDVGFFENYKNIILDETNVKEVTISFDVQSVANLGLKIDFSKCGKRIKQFTKDIIAAQKAGNFAINEDGSVLICGQVLFADEIDLSLISKQQNASTESFGSKFIVFLDTNISKDLELEGIARDFIRLIQQQRKEGGFYLSDKIKISVWSDDENIMNSLKQFSGNISEQTLASDIIFERNENQNVFDMDERSVGIFLFGQ